MKTSEAIQLRIDHLRETRTANERLNGRLRGLEEAAGIAREQERDAPVPESNEQDGPAVPVGWGYATNAERPVHLLEAMEAAWGLIANAWEGNWAAASSEWREAAERWRDQAWHRALAGDHTQAIYEVEVERLNREIDKLMKVCDQRHAAIQALLGGKALIVDRERLLEKVAAMVQEVIAEELA